METERDRRVFKGIVVELAGSTFCRQQFNWNLGSIAKIQEDMGMIDCFLADLTNLLTSIEYCAEVSPAKRRSMRRRARLKIALAGFMGSGKCTGAPSLIHRFS